MEKILITPRGFLAYGMGHIETLKEMGYEVIHVKDGSAFTREEFVSYAKEATGIIVGTEPMGRDLIEQCKNLKALVRYGVGTDNVDLECVREKGIMFDRCAGSNAVAVAEMTVALMFSMAKRLPAAVKNVKNSWWSKHDCLELYGKTIGIIGFGDIGKQVARIADGIGMRVIACATRPIAPEILEKYGAENLTFDEIIEQSDVISVNCPLTEKTRNMIGEKEFKKMKSHAIIVNTARGGIIDDRALLDALKNGDIGAAASDVFSPEPAPFEEEWVQELLSLDNYALTPHMSSRTKEADTNMVNMSAEKMIDMLKKL